MFMDPTNCTIIYDMSYSPVRFAVSIFKNSYTHWKIKFSFVTHFRGNLCLKYNVWIRIGGFLKAFYILSYNISGCGYRGSLNLHMWFNLVGVRTRPPTLIVEGAVADLVGKATWEAEIIRLFVGCRTLLLCRSSWLIECMSDGQKSDGSVDPFY